MTDSFRPAVGAMRPPATEGNITNAAALREETLARAQADGLEQARAAQHQREQQTNEMRRKWAIEQTVQLLHRKTHYEHEFFTMVDKIQKYLVSGELPHTGT